MNFDNIKKIKDELSFSGIFKNDSNNISSHFNTHRYRQLMEGNIKSPSLEMLLNFGKFSLSDLKTLDYFNNQGLAVKELAAGYLGEDENDNNIHLDKVIKRKLNFERIINHRKSYRTYIKKPLSINSFKKSLHPLVNTTNQENLMDMSFYHRAYASGGGLYPVSVYILTLNIENVSQGWYQLQPYSHTLRFLCRSNVDPDTLFVGHNIEISNSSYIIFYNFDFSKSYPKYGESATVLASIEIGEMSQLIDLTVAGLGLGSCQVAGFNRNLVSQELHIDNVSNHLLHSQIVGVI